MIFSALISAVIQTLLLTLIPFLVYVIGHKTAKGFWRWLGVHKFPQKALVYALIIAGASLILISLPQYWMFRQGYLYNNLNASLPAQALAQTGWGIQTMVVTLIWACIQTSFSEEIFFRGFVAKRLIGKIGFLGGNLLNAVLFGGIHLFGVIAYGFLPSAIIFLFTASIGFALGYLMEKKAEGSILPGWILHAAVNVLSTVIVSFYI
ncbi:CPBP family intramembrane metalloprotease [Ruminococcaceae bacterium OttesenSCG-928-N02]|nr:CPBP family intramembrane metalloprotease [Ruminococcaceae bacterium OttesenSCG-928-N02]